MGVHTHLRGQHVRDSAASHCLECEWTHKAGVRVRGSIERKHPNMPIALCQTKCQLSSTSLCTSPLLVPNQHWHTRLGPHFVQPLGGAWGRAPPSLRRPGHCALQRLS